MDKLNIKNETDMIAYIIYHFNIYNSNTTHAS